MVEDGVNVSGPWTLVHIYMGQRRTMVKDFKFECAWILENSFKSMMLSVWKSDLGMLQNLEEVRDHAKRWNIHSVQSLLKKKKAIMRRIEGIQRKAHEGVSHAGLRRLDGI